VPELDERTAQWLQWFGILNRTRPPAMGGLSPINPVTVLDLAERLQWPCEPDEAITVILALDDQFRELHAPANSG
jgi:hypothetical protein